MHQCWHYAIRVGRKSGSYEIDAKCFSTILCRTATRCGTQSRQCSHKRSNSHRRTLLHRYVIHKVGRLKAQFCNFCDTFVGSDHIGGVLRVGTAELANDIAQRITRIVTADRGFADVGLCELLDFYRVEYVIRTKATTKVLVDGEWRQLQTVSFITNSRRRNLGQVQYCESDPRKQWVSLSRVKNEHDKWEVWYLTSNRWWNAAQMAGEYARRFGCEQGFRDTKR